MNPATTKKDDGDMAALLETSPPFHAVEPGTLVDGIVISAAKNCVLVDLNGVSTGIISGREAKDSHDSMKDLGPGDTISAYVVDDEDENGLVVLSFRKASQEKSWNMFLNAYENDEAVTVTAHEANKGGLLLNVDGIKGFIPVSQLAPLHYPRVNGADANQILSRLKKLIGVQFIVKIINIDKENGKLILSEKAAMAEQRQAAMGKLNVGEKVKGKISGIVKFGIFVAFDGLEGLVHISEIAWGHVGDPSDYGKLGDPVEVLVIGLDNNKISLSIKQLGNDPWLEASKKYKLNSVVEGEINRITPFGAFIKLDSDINGLIHITEFAENSKNIEDFKIGDKLETKVIAIEPNDHRIGLSLNLKAKPKVEKEEAASEEAPAEDEKTE